MTFTESISAVYGKYATFSGRARRSEYWWWVLFQAVAGVVIGLVAMGMGLGRDFGSDPLSLIWSLANLLPGIAVSVRRLHDLDKSGWWLLIALIPLIGAIVLIVWFCSRGTVGPNQHGIDPVTG